MIFLIKACFVLVQSSVTGALIVAAFVMGLGTNSAIAPLFGGRKVEQPKLSPLAATEKEALRRHYPADVLRVVDGDTFEARVHIWPGVEVRTKVRLRGIDTPELDGRCAQEQAKADAARTALGAILREGGVGIDRVTPDKYGGRVLAEASTRKTLDIAAAMLAAGHGRPYGSGRRDGWCNVAGR